jgi:hypothetical protein
MSDATLNVGLARVLNGYFSPRRVQPATLRQTGADLEDWAVRVTAVALLSRLATTSIGGPLGRWPGNAPLIRGSVGPRAVNPQTTTLSFSVTASISVNPTTTSPLNWTVKVSRVGNEVVVNIARAGGQWVAAVYGRTQANGGITFTGEMTLPP